MISIYALPYVFGFGLIAVLSSVIVQHFMDRQKVALVGVLTIISSTIFLLNISYLEMFFGSLVTDKIGLNIITGLIITFYGFWPSLRNN